VLPDVVMSIIRWGGLLALVGAVVGIYALGPLMPKPEYPQPEGCQTYQASGQLWQCMMPGGEIRFFSPPNPELTLGVPAVIGAAVFAVGGLFLFRRTIGWGDDE
jgi:hypothetical protein